MTVARVAHMFACRVWSCVLLTPSLHRSVGLAADTDATSFSAIVNSVLTGAAGLGVALSSRQDRKPDKGDATIPRAVDDSIELVSS